MRIKLTSSNKKKNYKFKVIVGDNTNHKFFKSFPNYRQAKNWAKLASTAYMHDEVEVLKVVKRFRKN